MPTVYVSIGSNTAREKNIVAAVATLKKHFGTLRISNVYESASVDSSDTFYYNLVVGFGSDLSLTQLATQLRQIELQQGRVRTAEKSPQVSIDLDLLLYGDAVIDDGALQIPHRDIERYAFMLQPLAEIAADAIHPVKGKSYRSLWQQFDKSVLNQQCIKNFFSKEDVMEDYFAKIITAIGEDITREGLLDTPKRAAKAFKFLNNGYEKNLDDILNGAIFAADTEDMVIVKNIELYSLCEHHLLPFIGKCHIAYLPNGNVLGLSKLARIVDMYARRLQIQEKLTKQIADAVQTAINARGVAVVIEAQHLCMMMRGVEKQNSVMTTSVMLGTFRQHISTRAEFLSLINNNRATPFG